MSTTPSPSRKPVRTGAVPHEVRIIGGQWKRTPLAVPELPGLRPTPARVRETLFNWLGQDLSGWRCADAFAGSGALGLEAASRGATEVWLIEQEPLLVRNLQKTVLRLGATAVRVERGDALAVLGRLAGQGLDLVFLDPPFGGGDNEALFHRALEAARQTLSPRGLVYLEAPRAWTDAELHAHGLAVHRQGRAGAVHHALLQVGVPA
jgi:16S rRNA (guanine(966)-N(2))-methyltransferase RsmD